MFIKRYLILELVGLSLIAVLSSCNSPYYKAMESVGIFKRDILVDRVKEGKDAQEDAKEQFKTTLERFTELTQFDGGDLEKVYKKLSKELERSESRAADVSKNIHDIEDVSKELFAEWKKELKEYENQEFKAHSAAQLKETQARYKDLIEAMKKAEASIQPVLKTFQDQVLFLKHNLNAKAIASLDQQVVSLRSDIELLIQDMESSIDEADAFITMMNADKE